MIFVSKLILSSLWISLVSSILSRILQRDTYVSSELKFTCYYSCYCCILTLTLSLLCILFISAPQETGKQYLQQDNEERKKSQHNFKKQKNAYHDVMVTANFALWVFFFPKGPLRHLLFFSAAILRTCCSTTIIAGANCFCSWTVINEDSWRDASWLR